MKQKKDTRLFKQRSIPPSILIMMLFLGALVFLAILTPLLFPVDLGATDLRHRLAVPAFIDHASPYLIGTDELGRDLFIRLLYGMRTSLIVAFTGMLIALALGLAMGVAGGILGGKTDAFLMMLVDARLSVPTTIIGIICVCVLGPSQEALIFVIGMTGWSGFARLIRGQILQLKNTSFIACSRSIGASPMRIIIEHVLPNIASPIIVEATLSMSGFILLESSLSFMGLGIQPPNTSLGVLVSIGRDFMINQWWLAIAPGALITVIILQVSLIGDWLRDKLDPKLKNKS
jgi:peptide/nickel transport system permease protein